jgi:WD40 repeat protein
MRADEEIKAARDPLRLSSIVYPIVATFPASRIMPGGLCWSGDGETLAFVSPSRDVCLWSVHSRSITATLKNENNTCIIPSLAWSPDNKHLAAGTDHKVQLWNVQRPELVSMLCGHDVLVQAVVFHPVESQLFSASEDSKVRVWDLATEAVAATMQQSSLFHRVDGIALSRDGTLLATTQGRSVRLWDMTTRAVLVDLPLDDTNCSKSGIEPMGMGFSPDGRLLAAPCGEMVRVFDVASRTVAADLAGHGGRVHWVEFSADGALLASASKDGTARVWGLDGP